MARTTNYTPNRGYQIPLNDTRARGVLYCHGLAIKGKSKEMKQKGIITLPMEL